MFEKRFAFFKDIHAINQIGAAPHIPKIMLVDTVKEWLEPLDLKR